MWSVLNELFKIMPPPTFAVESLCRPVFIPLRHIFRSGMTGSYGKCVLDFLRNYEKVLSKVAIPLYTPPAMYKYSSFPTFSLTLVMTVLLAGRNSNE